MLPDAPGSAALIEPSADVLNPETNYHLRLTDKAPISSHFPSSSGARTLIKTEDRSAEARPPHLAAPLDMSEAECSGELNCISSSRDAAQADLFTGCLMKRHIKPVGFWENGL